MTRNLKLECAKSTCRYMAELGVLASPTIAKFGGDVGFLVIGYGARDSHKYKVKQSLFSDAQQLQEFAIWAAARARGVLA